MEKRHFTLRLEDDIHGELTEAARQKGRSLQVFILDCLRWYLDRGKVVELGKVEDVLRTVGIEERVANQVIEGLKR